MDSAIRDIGYKLMNFPPYPFLDVAHSLLTCYYFRTQVGVMYSRQHPIESFVFCMLTIFSGEVFTNLLLGEPLLQVFNNNQQVLIAAASWYAMFFIPLGFGFRLLRSLPVKIPVSIAKEIYRCWKVYDGVNRAAYYYSSSVMAKILTGVVRGNSGGFVKQVRYKLFGTGTGSQPNLCPWTLDIPTLRSLMAAAIFTIYRDFNVMATPIEPIYLGIVAFFVYFKVNSVLGGCCPIGFGAGCAFKFRL